MPNQTKPNIHIAVGKTPEGNTGYFVVIGTEIVSSHSTAAEAMSARSMLIVERLAGGCRDHRRCEYSGAIELAFN
jgi:hypothetical protein